MLGLPDHQAFAGRFHDFLAYFPQLIDFGDPLNLSQ
jgi:hypothetical protein